MKRALEEGIDFYFNEQGYLVFTGKYLLSRGYCCGNGCRNCPYDYINVPEPEKSKLLQKRQAANNQDAQLP